MSSDAQTAVQARAGSEKAQISYFSKVRADPPPDDPGFTTTCDVFELKPGYTKSSDRIQKKLQNFEQLCHRLPGIVICGAGALPEQRIWIFLLYSSFNAFECVCKDEEMLQWLDSFEEVCLLQQRSVHGKGEDIQAVQSDVQYLYEHKALFYSIVGGIGFARFSYFQGYCPVAARGEWECPMDSMVLFMPRQRLREGVHMGQARVQSILRSLQAHAEGVGGCVYYCALYEDSTRCIVWRKAFSDGNAFKLYMQGLMELPQISEMLELFDTEEVLLAGKACELQSIREAEFDLCASAMYCDLEFGWSRL